ncbi:MAG TPA: hypothetical protein VEI54_07070 [Candidatus Limnocylindrales bacterium]|nr:hypothetical protein [Candidatus Limnocylindrales bacterium]
MLAFKLAMLIFAAAIFATALAVVAHDVYVAARLRRLLGRPILARCTSRAKPARHAKAITIFGGARRARPASLGHRPQPLWVARFASQVERP